MIFNHKNIFIFFIKLFIRLLYIILCINNINILILFKL